MQSLFEKIEACQQDKVVELSLSYLEIYNETIKDLIVPGKVLMLQEDGKNRISVARLSTHVPRDVRLPDLCYISLSDKII